MTDNANVAPAVEAPVDAPPPTTEPAAGPAAAPPPQQQDLGLKDPAPTGADLTPHQKFLEMLSDDLKTEPSFLDFKGESLDEIVSKLGKSYLNTKKLVGADKNSVLKIPESQEDTEAYGEIYDKLGRPETVDGYELEDIVKDSDFIDSDKLKTFAEIVHKNGGNKQLMQELTQAYVEDLSGMGAASDEQVTEMIQGYDQTLEKLWGQAKDDKLQKIQNVINKYANDEFKKIVIDNPVIFEHPTVSEFFDQAFSGMAEDTGAGRAGTAAEAAMTPTEAKAEINRLDLDETSRKIMMTPGDPRREDLMARRNKLFGYAYNS